MEFEKLLIEQPLEVFSSPSRSQLRKLIAKLCPDASGLESFIFDNFPQFGNELPTGLDWTSKVNFLLQNFSPTQILEKLRITFPSAELSSSQEDDKSPQIRYTVVFTASINTEDKGKIEALVKHLRTISGDTNITIEEIKAK